jgi:hypothetical protein
MSFENLSKKLLENMTSPSISNNVINFGLSRSFYGHSHKKTQIHVSISFPFVEKKFKVCNVKGNITMNLTCMLTYKMACQNVVNEHVVKKKVSTCSN